MAAAGARDLRLFIVNKSGGLIFQRDFGSVAKLDTNDTLRLASIWHSLHAIASQLSPRPGCGAPAASSFFWQGAASNDAVHFALTTARRRTQAASYC